MINLIKVVISAESFFALFLFASYLKSFFPNTIDLTIVFLVLSFVAAVVRLFKNPNLHKSWLLPITLFFLFIALALVSLLYSPSTYYANEKIIKLIGMTGWSFIGAFLIFRDKKSLKKFMDASLVITFFLSAFFLYEFATNPYGIVGTENYLPKARIAGISALLFLTRFLFSEKRSKRSSIISLAGFLITFSVLVSTGARTPIFSILIIILIMSFGLVKIGKGKTIYYTKTIIPFIFLVFISILSLIYLYSAGFLETSIRRITLLLGNDGYSTGRYERYEIALKSWSDSLTNFIGGEGIGSFAIIYKGIDTTDYPHNIFVELIAEFGVLGLLLVVSLLLVAVWRFYSNKTNDLLYKQVLLLTIFIFINANIAGDINDNRMLFSFVAVMTLPIWIGSKSIINNQKLKVS